MTSTEKRIIDLLQAKLRRDPKGFREYLSTVADLLPSPSPNRPAKSLRGLTEQELAFHKSGLQKALEKLDKGAIAPQEAVRGLEHGANLIRHDSFTEDIPSEVAKRLFKAAFGKLPSSYRSKTTISVDGESSGPVKERVTVLRGVYLALDSNRRLVSVSVNPTKVREMVKMMKIVGIIKDAPSDIAEKHDEYLAMIDPHGRD